ARHYELDGRWPLARACLRALVQAEEKNPLHLAVTVQALLRHGEREEARRLFEQFDGNARRTPEVIELGARLLHAEGKPSEAVELLAKYQGNKVERLAPVALVLESLGENEAAEQMLRRLAANPKQPAGLLLLARHLAHRKRTEEALQMCERAWGRTRDE